MAKNEDKQNKTIRSTYYFHQITPILGYSLILGTVLVAKSLIGEYYPITSGNALSTNKATIKSLESTMMNLNRQKQSSLQEKQHLETVITDLKSKKESDGSLRFYSINLPAYGRYVEYRANANSIEIVSVDIHEAENKIDYIVLGDYNNLVAFFNTLETREIYYIENFELIPSFNNSGSYVKFTANFNLDATIMQRYEKKNKFENLEENEISLEETLNVVPEDESLSTIDVVVDAPDDTMNTGKNKQNLTTQQSENENSTPQNGIIVEPLN